MTQLQSLTTAEFARLQEILAGVPFAQLLGVSLVQAERGAATLSLPARPDLQRMDGILHGGVIFSLMDTAAAFAVHSSLETEEKTLTFNFTLHFLRPARAGKLTAHARVLRAGRRLVTLSIEASDGHGELIATALTTYARKR
ncbi:PaaI family thioesterase [soil metagenome]